MARVDIEINGRPYRFGCEDGQEQRLHELAAYVDQRLKEMTGGGKLGSDAQMLAVTCVVLADELQEALAQRDRAVAAAAQPAPPRTDGAELAATVDHVARRIEEVAVRLERA